MDEYSSPTAAQRASNVQLAASLAAEAADLLRNANVEGLAHKARELAYECETARETLDRVAGYRALADYLGPLVQSSLNAVALATHYWEEGRWVDGVLYFEVASKYTRSGNPLPVQWSPDRPEPRETAQCADCGQSIRVEHGHFAPHGDGRPDERSCEGSGRPPSTVRGPINAGVTPLRTLSNDDYGA